MPSAALLAHGCAEQGRDPSQFASNALAAETRETLCLRCRSLILQMFEWVEQILEIHGSGRHSINKQGALDAEMVREGDQRGLIWSVAPRKGAHQGTRQPPARAQGYLCSSRSNNCTARAPGAA
jgi:hypothetical protein